MKRLFWVFRDTTAWFGIDSGFEGYTRTALDVPCVVRFDEANNVFWFGFRSIEDWKRAEGNADWTEFRA